MPNPVHSQNLDQGGYAVFPGECFLQRKVFYIVHGAGLGWYNFSIEENATNPDTAEQHFKDARYDTRDKTLSDGCFGSYSVKDHRDAGGDQNTKRSGVGNQSRAQGS